MLFEGTEKMPDNENNKQAVSMEGREVNEAKLEIEDKKDVERKVGEGDAELNESEDRASESKNADSKPEEPMEKTNSVKSKTGVLSDEVTERIGEAKESGAAYQKKKRLAEDEVDGKDDKQNISEKDEKKHSSPKEGKVDNLKKEKSPSSPSKNKKRKAPVDEESDEDNQDDKEEIEVPQKKSRKRMPSEEEEDEEEDDEEEDDEEELKPGLLEQPVVLEEGLKREKKKVQRLELTPPSASREKKLDIPEGSGEKLGEIPRIEFQLNKTLSDDLRPLHRLLFFRVGSASEVKRNIRRFSGFAFAKNSSDFKKKFDQLNKMTMATLKSICEVLDLERSGKKEDIVERIMNFLLKPKSSGKALPKSKKRRSSTSDKSKKSRSQKKSTPKRKSSAKKSETETEEDEEDENEEEEEELEEEQEEEKEDESSDEDYDAKKKKVRKAKSTKKKPKNGSKGEEKKSKNPAKNKKTPISKKRPRDSESGESSDEEPLKRQKAEPSNDELKEVVKKILEGANLEEVTMKTVYKQVFEKYPDFDLSSRKDFIKAAVKQIIR